MITDARGLHPGQIIKLKLKVMGVSISAAARALGVSRTHFSDVVNGHAGITALMALKIAHGIGGSAERWMDIQATYELYLARQQFSATSSSMVRKIGQGEK